MAWYDSVGSWFGGGSGGGTDWWSSVGDSWMGDGGGSDWWDTAAGIADDWFTSDGGGSSGSGGWLDAIGGWLGSGGSGGSAGSGGGNIWEYLMAGVGGAAGALIDEKTVREAGKEKRKILDFEEQLRDFSAQKDKARKRAALDSYGQFSLVDRWAPNTTPAPPVETPARPNF